MDGEVDKYQLAELAEGIINKINTLVDSELETIEKDERVFVYTYLKE